MTGSVKNAKSLFTYSQILGKYQKYLRTFIIKKKSHTLCGWKQRQVLTDKNIRIFFKSLFPFLAYERKNTIMN